MFQGLLANLIAIEAWSKVVAVIGYIELIQSRSDCQRWVSWTLNSDRQCRNHTACILLHLCLQYLQDKTVLTELSDCAIRWLGSIDEHSRECYRPELIGKRNLQDLAICTSDQQKDLRENSIFETAPREKINSPHLKSSLVFKQPMIVPKRNCKWSHSVLAGEEGEACMRFEIF